VSRGSEQDQDAELARNAEALREQGMPIFRRVQEYIVGGGAAEGSAACAARQVSAAMDLEMAEVLAAVRKQVIIGPNQAIEAMAVLDADMITLSEGASVLPLEDVGELSVKVARDGIAGLTTTQMLVLVLLWLLTIGAPVVQQALPPEAQTLLNSEYGTIGIAIAITLAIVSRKR
jgi:hypothetical protein